MAVIPTYSVPPEIWKAEESKEPVPVNFTCDSYRKNQHQYLKAYKTMVHLEEAAQTMFMKTFDQTEVRIFYSGLGRIFFFLNEVSNKIKFIFYTQIRMTHCLSHRIEWPK